MVAYLPAARDPEVHIQTLVWGRRLTSQVLWQRVENHHCGLGRKEGDWNPGLASIIFVDGALEYLSRAVGTAPLPLAVQPLEQRFSFLHAVESHQCEQGVTGGLQGEQVVPSVGPVVNAWWTDGEQLAGTTFSTGQMGELFQKHCTRLEKKLCLPL